MTEGYLPYGHHSVAQEDIDAVVEVLRSDWLTQGPTVARFEDAVAGYCGARHAVAVSSGTAALHIACLAAGIGPGDEVVTSALTFVASANCVAYCGGEPRLADVDPVYRNLDPVSLEGAITRRAKAVIPVDFGGHPCFPHEISRVARDHGLIVIEDAAHALGAEYDGTKVGSCEHADMAVLSFHPVKLITSGEGGMVLTNDDELRERLLRFRNHGITRERGAFEAASGERAGDWYYEQQDLGFNYRITDFQCALGVSQLGHADGFLEARRTLAGMYAERLADCADIQLPCEADGVRSAWHIYPISLKEPVRRAEVFAVMRADGIGVQVHYIPVHHHPFYRRRPEVAPTALPNAEAYYAGAITLPLFPAMTERDVDRVVASLEGAL